LFAQKIEDVRNGDNCIVSVSFYAKAASGTPKVAIELEQNFGSGGSTRVLTYGGQVTLSTTWNRYTVQVLLPSVTSKTIGSSSFLLLNLWCSAGADFNSRTGSIGIQNNTFDFWGVQLEQNHQPTPFEQRPIGVELALCQRYCQLVVSGTGLMVCNGSAYTSSAFYGIYHNKSSMRVAPTAVISTGTGHWFLAGNNNQHSFSTIAMDVSGTETVRFSATSGITINQGSAYWLQSNNAASSIVLSAEL
jgi:hypothetical protein